MTFQDTDYQFCPASATTALKGRGAGTVKNVLKNLVITPLTASPGAVSIQDGNGTIYQLMAAGTVAGLQPIILNLECLSYVGGWSVICGANVTAFATGRFI